jgi:hypothetical protein
LTASRSHFPQSGRMTRSFNWNMTFCDIIHVLSILQWFAVCLINVGIKFISNNCCLEVGTAVWIGSTSSRGRPWGRGWDTGLGSGKGHPRSQGLSAARVLPRPWDTPNRNCKKTCTNF